MPSISGQNDASSYRLGIVISRFNETITQRLYDGAMAKLAQYKISFDQINAIWVPGAVEIPVVAQRLARSGKYHAVICLGAVIRGETTHYDYVCQQVSQGCQQIALENDMPILFGILTTENEFQALERAGGEHGNKGADAVDAAVEMIGVMQNLN